MSASAGRPEGPGLRGAQSRSAKGTGIEERGLREARRWGRKQRPLPAMEEVWGTAQQKQTEQVSQKVPLPGDRRVTKNFKP